MKKDIVKNEEKELLTIFRKLSPENQKLALANFHLLSVAEQTVMGSLLKSGSVCTENNPATVQREKSR